VPLRQKEEKPAKKVNEKGTHGKSGCIYEELRGIATFSHHNRKTQGEFELEGKLGEKKRIKTIYEQRNGLPMSSLGDKVYKAVEYQSGFFKEGGLVVGSS
jgi:outer membrane biogenesis lipoprotein LolB